MEPGSHREQWQPHSDSLLLSVSSTNELADSLPREMESRVASHCRTLPLPEPLARTTGVPQAPRKEGPLDPFFCFFFFRAGPAEVEVEEEDPLSVLGTTGDTPAPED